MVRHVMSAVTPSLVSQTISTLCPTTYSTVVLLCCETNSINDNAVKLQSNKSWRNMEQLRVEPAR